LATDPQLLRVERSLSRYAEEQDVSLRVCSYFPNADTLQIEVSHVTRLLFQSITSDDAPVFGAFGLDKFAAHVLRSSFDIHLRSSGNADSNTLSDSLTALGLPSTSQSDDLLALPIDDEKTALRARLADIMEDVAVLAELCESITSRTLETYKQLRVDGQLVEIKEGGGSRTIIRKGNAAGHRLDLEAMQVSYKHGYYRNTVHQADIKHLSGSNITDLITSPQRLSIKSSMMHLRLYRLGTEYTIDQTPNKQQGSQAFRLERESEEIHNQCVERCGGDLSQADENFEQDPRVRQINQTLLNIVESASRRERDRISAEHRQAALGASRGERNRIPA
jgi:hypothetical protein